MESSSPSILFEALVLCDDVRFENNGKLLLQYTQVKSVWVDLT